MSEKIINRPAFPCGESYTTTDLAGNETRHSKGPLHHGMSLRDYFAAQVIGHLICSDSRSEYTTDADARYAYQVADAMLKERAL